MAVSATRGRGRDRATRRAASDEVRRCSSAFGKKRKSVSSCRRNTEGLFSAPLSSGFPTLQHTATMALPTSRGLFRSLLRARSVAFKGDPTALSAARVEIRKHFDVRPRDRPPPSSLHTARRSPSLTRPPPSVPPPAGVQAPRPRGRAGEDQGGRRGGELHPPARRAGGGQRARQLRDANRVAARGRRVRGARGWRVRGRGRKEKRVKPLSIFNSSSRRAVSPLRAPSAPY